jgi:hypothetical protein
MVVPVPARPQPQRRRSSVTRAGAEAAVAAAAAPARARRQSVSAELLHLMKAKNDFSANARLLEMTSVGPVGERCGGHARPGAVCRTDAPHTRGRHARARTHKPQ